MADCFYRLIGCSWICTAGELWIVGAVDCWSVPNFGLMERCFLHVWLFAFLDDLSVITTRERAAKALEIVTREVSERAGVKTHLGTPA